MHFLSSGPCHRTYGQFWNELLEHQLLPRRYHAWYSRGGARSGDEDDNGFSFPLSYNKLVERYPHIEKDHLVKLLKQLMVRSAPPLQGIVGGGTLGASDVPTLLGTGSFSLLESTFDRLGRYVITDLDDRLVKIWSMETAFCLCSCRGHEGDITDLAVSSNNALIASSSNDCIIRAWRLPDGLQISVLRGHTGAVTAIAFSPRPSAIYQILSFPVPLSLDVIKRRLEFGYYRSMGGVKHDIEVMLSNAQSYLPRVQNLGRR